MGTTQPLRVGTWMLIDRPGQGEFVCFTYVDPGKGLCAKGGPPDQEDLATRPSVTFHSLPWPNLRWRFLSLDEIRRRGLPPLPDWVRFYGPQPHAGITWDAPLDDRPAVGSAAGGASGFAAAPRRPPPVDPWEVGDDVGGLLQIEQILGGPGRSGMGTVYVGHGSLFGRVCAVKTLQDHLLHDAAIRARFRQEALTWIRLDAHDNVVQAYSWQVLDNRPCLFMEYVDGGDLGRWIGTPALLDHPELALRFAVDFCNGMIHVVSRGLQVHRDVKPQNCLVTGGERPVLKVTDFGLAKALDGSPAGSRADAGDPRQLSVHATRYGQAIGTCTHMAPEQFADARRVDIRADVYAFGIMLFQMITGRLPFEGRTWQEFHRLHATAPPPSLPPGSPRDLDALVKTCLAKDPADRFADFWVLRDRLRQISAMLPGYLAAAEGEERRLDRKQLSFKAQSLGFLGHNVESVLLHDQAIAEDPDDAGIDWIGKINALRASGRYEAALACADQAASRLPAMQESNGLLWWAWWMAKGEALLALNRLADALACFDRAVDLDESVDLGWSRKAEVLTRLERYRESADCYGRLVRLDAENPDNWFRLGDALRRAGRAGEAVPAFDRAISLRPDSTPAWVNRGLALSAHGGQHDEQTMVQALYSVDQAIKINRRDPEPWFHKALLLVFYQRPDDALACMAEAGRLGHPSAAVMLEALQSQDQGRRPAGGA